MFINFVFIPNELFQGYSNTIGLLNISVVSDTALEVFNCTNSKKFQRYICEQGFYLSKIAAL